MELWALAHGATIVAGVQGTGVHPLCRALEGVGGPQTATFPAWYACRGDDNDMVDCSPTGRVYEYRTFLSGEDWSSVSSTTNLGSKTDPTIGSTWWAFEGRRETPPDERTGVTGLGWIDCDGYYAYGGEADGDRDHRGSIRRALDYKGAPSIELASGPQAKQESTEERTDRFVHTADDDCHPTWASWPAVQEAAIARGTVLVYNVFPSVGNLFVVLHNLIKTARLLEVALLFNWRSFEGFREAFDPASIKWNLEPTSFVERAQQWTPGAEAERLFLFNFGDGQLVLCYWQLEFFARMTSIPGTSVAEAATALQGGYSKGGLMHLSRDIVKHEPLPLQPCAWNMLLRRSPAMMTSLGAHNPWTSYGFDPLPKEYVAWHIRTSDGESKISFTPGVHSYIFHDQSSTTVFPIFLSATDAAEKMCPRFFHQDASVTPVYISSNSKSMSRNCTKVAATLAAERKVRPGYIDLGIDDLDAHTSFSKNPKATALNAFIDYLYLMDSSVIVQTGSSFSFTVAGIKGLRCVGVAKPEGLPVKALNVCLPVEC